MAESKRMAEALDIATEVIGERQRQDAKWGVQMHPNGTGLEVHVRQAEWGKHETDKHAAAGTVNWLHILREEVLEAFAESDLLNLRTELIQVAAVAQAWVQDIDRQRMDEVHAERVARRDAQEADRG